MKTLLLLLLLLAGLPDVMSAQDLLKQHFPDLNFTEISRSSGADGRTYVRYQQTHDGVEVLGGEVVVQLDRRGRERYLSGSPASLPSPAPAAAALPEPVEGPALATSALADRARRHLLPRYPFAASWDVTDRGEIWTTANPWSVSPGRYVRCRVFEVSEPAGFSAEMVYVAAATGKVVFEHPLHCDLQRRLHHANTASSNLVWNEGDAFPGALNDDDATMITATQEVYSLYYRTFGRRSYNGSGAPLRTVTEAAISGCPNARAYNGIVLACSGVVGDDIVGHEWTHNYTNALNGLLFRYESGAIQEAYADIFGEAVDLLNDYGLDAGDQQRRDGCFAGNYRWSIAEDATAIDTILRDLWTPECKTDPATTASENFMCANNLGQDIHSNSLVVSRTFALLTDGDTTAVESVAGIGLTKALHIFYHANAHYVTRVTDFSALAAMLRRSARDLRGTNLRALTLLNTVAPLSNQYITDADLASLDAAIAATGLDRAADCPTVPTLAQQPPSGCEEADISNFAVVFREDWEGDSLYWTTAEHPVHPNTWDEKPWRAVGNLPDQRSGTAMFAPNAHAGNCQTDRDNGTVDLTSPLITLPDGETGFMLRFDHYYAIEERTDGGRLSISINRGDFVPLAASVFLYNGYDGTLDPAFSNDNPLAGAAAFTGADRFSTTGTWGTSLVDLSAAGALPGDDIQLRWTLGHDGCDGWLGWFLDDVTVGFCGAATLPVEYLSFTATGRKQQIDLNWATAREENNAGFFVTRSAGSGGFTDLGFVPAGTATYRFTDGDVRPGQHYFYQLRQTDHDGTSRLSAVVTATAGGAELMVYPNPNRGTFRVAGADGPVRIFSLDGRLVRQFSALGNTEVSGLAPGVYLVRAGDMVRRVVVQ